MNKKELDWLKELSFELCDLKDEVDKVIGKIDAYIYKKRGIR